MGPYEILQRVGKVAYELTLPGELASVHPFFHVSMLKKCISDPKSSLSTEKGKYTLELSKMVCEYPSLYYGDASTPAVQKVEHLCPSP